MKKEIKGGKQLHKGNGFSVHSVSVEESPDDLRVVFTDMVNKKILVMIADMDRIALFKDMDPRDQVSCVQSGLLSALSIYLAAMTPTHEIHAKVKTALIEALPMVIDAGAAHVARIEQLANMPPKPEA